MKKLNQRQKSIALARRNQLDEGIIDTIKEKGSQVLDWVQNALDLVGMIPEIGIPFNIGNGVLYLLRGKFIDSLICFIGAAPFIGEAIADEAKVVKFLVKLGLKEGEKGAQVVSFLLKHNKKAKEALKVVSDNKGKINTVLKYIKEHPSQEVQEKVVPHIDKLEKALDQFHKQTDRLNRLAAAPSDEGEEALSRQDIEGAIRDARNETVNENNLRFIIRTEVRRALLKS